MGILGWTCILGVNERVVDGATISIAIQNSVVTFLYASALVLAVLLFNTFRGRSTNFARDIAVAFAAVWLAQSLIITGKTQTRSALGSNATSQDNAEMAAEAKTIFSKCPYLNPHDSHFNNNVATQVVARRDDLITKGRAPAMALVQSVSEIAPACNR